jgi:hypothetical protein
VPPPNIERPTAAVRTIASSSRGLASRNGVGDNSIVSIAGTGRSLGRDCDHGFGAAGGVHILRATVAQGIHYRTRLSAR